jgi:hypothetical protein
MKRPVRLSLAFAAALVCGCASADTAPITSELALHYTATDRVVPLEQTFVLERP